MSAAMSFIYTFRRSSMIGQRLVLRYSFRMNTDRKYMLAVGLSFMFTQPANCAPFIGAPDNSAQKMPTISNVVSISSSSTIVAKWLTADTASSSLACGTRQGFFVHTSVDRNNVLATTHESVVAGLRPSTVYYCRITAANRGGATHSTFSLSTVAEEASTPIKGLTFGPAAG